MYRRSLIAAIVVCSAFLLCTQPGKKTLARVGEENITVSEFKSTIIPSLEPGIDEEEVKQKHLDALINKKLLTLEAERQNVDTLRRVKDELEDLRRQLLLKTLYEDVVVKKSEISEAEMRRAYEIMDEVVKLRQIVVDTKGEAERIYGKLEEGLPFDSLAKEYSKDEMTREQGGELSEMTLLFMEEPVQDAIRYLGEGQVTEPIPFGDRFKIIQVVARRKTSKGDYEEEKPRLTQQLKQRKQRELANDFIASVKKRSRLVYNLQLLDLLSRSPERPSPEDMMDWVAKYYNQTVTVRDLVEFVRRFGFLPPDQKEQQIRNKVERDLLFYEAKRRHLDDKPEFKKEYRRLKDDILYSHFYETMVADRVEVKDEEIEAYYQEYREDYTVPERRQISLILTEDEEGATILHKRIQDGEDFEMLAETYSIHPSKGQKGNLGYRTRDDTLYAEVVTEGFNLKEGELSDPFKTEIGYALVKCDKILPERVRALEEVRGSIRNRIFRDKSEELIQEFADELKKTIEVEINEHLLAQIELKEEEK